MVWHSIGLVCIRSVISRPRLTRSLPRCSSANPTSHHHTPAFLSLSLYLLFTLLPLLLLPLPLPPLLLPPLLLPRSPALVRDNLVGG